ncbi:MAG TPA: GDYXXLXY domain-containing protein [Flavobacteriaceae bacterium]|nr:GDYXXLXY domain-containing protein [Flavobacteriaceae bacterium]
MNLKKLLLPAFILVAFVQLSVPVKMIWDREDVLATGTTYKFETAPIDPNDPFRGKYIHLRFKEDIIAVPNAKDWEMGETIYVRLTKDQNGFAKIKSVSKSKPSSEQDFVKAKVRFITGNASDKLAIDYPFDRFYMEESKAQHAEQTYRYSQQDSTKTTYAVVSIKKGDAVLKDVLIDGISIKKIVESDQKRE